MHIHKSLPAFRDSRPTGAGDQHRGQRRAGMTRMFPDLRFVFGALIATALSGVTLFGLTAAMHISHQSKLSPLEASRLLSYTPEGRHRPFDAPAPRFESPFANIPADPNPVLLQQPAGPAQSAEPSVEIVAVAQPAGLRPIDPSAPPEPSQQTAAVEPENLPPPGDDTDAVDERAVIDPPLPLENDAPAAAGDAASAAPSPEPAAAAIEPVETAPAAPAPVVDTTTPAAPRAVSDTPIEPNASGAQLVASLSPAAGGEARSDARAAPAVTQVKEARERKAKRKRARKAAAKRKRPAPAQRAQAPTLFNPFASTGYPVTTTSTANRPAKGFWPLD